MTNSIILIQNASENLWKLLIDQIPIILIMNGKVFLAKKDPIPTNLINKSYLYLVCTTLGLSILVTSWCISTLLVFHISWTFFKSQCPKILHKEFTLVFLLLAHVLDLLWRNTLSKNILESKNFLNKPKFYHL